MDKKKSLGIYLLLVIASVGYYHNLERTDSFRYVFALIFLIGLGLILFKNYRAYKKTGRSFVLLDIGFILWVVLVPRLGSGLARFIMALGGAVYGLKFLNKSQ